MAERDTPHTFTPFGGPLYRFGVRLGLVRGDFGPVCLGIAVGGFLWVVLMALGFVDGLGSRILSLELIAGHVRLLVAIPLLFVCEAWLAPRCAAFVSGIVRAGVVPAAALPALEAEIAQLNRWKESRVPELACLLAAVLITLTAPSLSLGGVSAAQDPSRTFADMPAVGQWYWFVCLTVFRFLALRWLWQFALWCHFLWRLARLPLNLVATHPDRVAGLGYLEVVHGEFAPLIAAISAVQSAALAEDILAGRMAFEAIYPTVLLIIVVELVLFVGPLFLFSQKLWLCRVNGWTAYMGLASRYVNDFDRKWLGAGRAGGEPLLGTADLQSLADLSNSVNVVRGMNVVPMSQRTMLSLAVAGLLPLLPLLLFKYPIDELIGKLFSTFLGM